MGRQEGCAFKEWTQREILFCYLLLHLALCLIAFVLTALLIMIITAIVQRKNLMLTSEGNDYRANEVPVIM